jgi:hypothetical protein
MKIQREDTAIVFTDPQNEVLGEKGLGWPLVRESLQENTTSLPPTTALRASGSKYFGINSKSSSPVAGSRK